MLNLATRSVFPANAFTMSDTLGPGNHRWKYDLTSCRSFNSGPFLQALSWEISLFEGFSCVVQGVELTVWAHGFGWARDGLRMTMRIRPHRARRFIHARSYEGDRAGASKERPCLL